MSAGLAADTERAQVESVTYETCPPPLTGQCGQGQVRIETGPDEGDVATLTLGGTGLEPELEPGDAIRVARAEGGPTAASAYTLADFERRAPMLWLAVVFAVLVVVFGRVRGALSLVGLGVSLTVVLDDFLPTPAMRETGRTRQSPAVGYPVPFTGHQIWGSWFPRLSPVRLRAGDTGRRGPHAQPSRHERRFAHTGGG